MALGHPVAKIIANRSSRRKLLRFVARQDGNISIFAMTLFMLMTMMGGLAVDLMRFEAKRTALQNTLDRATLASASLNQRIKGEKVVRDYFDKAKLTQYLTSVVVTEGLNFRNVMATASADTDPMFMHLVGQKQMHATGMSMAEQRITNVEIMLVLDVSGSMNSNNRLANLKIAANEFVDTVLASDAEKRISIGIVPFNGQVNLPVDLRDKFNFANNPNATNVNCFDLDASVYNGSGISRSTVMTMTANADTYSGTTGALNWIDVSDTSNAAPNGANVWCPPRPNNVVSMPEQGITSLQGKITALTAIGATSINAGLKWGVALMDPSAMSIYNEYRAAGTMPSTLAGRPFAYTDNEALKIIVLMTDGEHFAEERVNTPYKSGPSPISRSADDGYYSIFFASKPVPNQHYVPHLDTWQAAPWTNATNTGTAVGQSWPEVWTKMRLSFVAWQFYGRALGGTDGAARSLAYGNAMDAFRSKTPTTTMDSQLQNICAQAKTNAVIVYGIAFEAPTNGQTQIRNCSTSPAHYYNASGLQIRTAFRSIASNISQLRLTQ